MLPLRDAFLELSGSIFNASICWDVWWELQNAENQSHERYQTVAEKYGLFFEANAGAQFVTIIVLLYQVFERRADTQNFHRLIERLKGEDSTAQDLAVSLQEQVAGLMPTCKKVARVRSSVIAHLSHRASSESLMQSAALTPNEIRDLLTNSKAFVRTIAAHLGVDDTAMDMSAVTDTRELMLALEATNEAMHATYEDARA